MFEQGQTFEQFLDEYYAMGPQGYLALASKGRMKLGDADIKKILTHTETNWFENAYMKDVQLMLSLNTELYKLLDKKPITAVGNSFKYTEALGLQDTALGPGGAEAIFGTATEPSISTLTGITSGVEKVLLERDLHSMIVEKIPDAHPGAPDWDWLKNELAPNALWDKIDKWLGGYETATNVHGVDTPALKNIECLDRVISNGVESGATNHVSAATDGDFKWDGLGTGTSKIIRASATWADAQIKLPTVAGTAEAFELPDEIDTIVAVAKKYSKNKRYIGITTDATQDYLESWFNPKEHILEVETKVQQTIGGVNTRPGPTVGVDIGAIRSCGLTIPIFTSNALPTKNSVYTTATKGHFYLVDLDSMYIRVDIPATFLETGFGAEMLHQNYLRSRGLLFTVAQLVCTNFKANGAIKWIKN